MLPALSSYRTLLRAIYAKFRGDEAMVSKAIENVRSRYNAHRHEVDPAVVEEKLIEAQEAAMFLRDFVVQSEQTPAGRFRIKLTAAQVASMQETPDPTQP